MRAQENGDAGLDCGGAGFLGFHLAARLLRAEHRVVVTDDLGTGRISNLAPLRTSPLFEFVPRSVLDSFWLPVDVIYNFASPASPRHYRATPERTLRTTVEGTMKLLQLAEETESHYIHVSTSEVYGNPCEHPQKESYLGNVQTMGPRACYDESKRCAETLRYVYRMRGVPGSVVRIFNTYGPHARRRRAGHRELADSGIDGRAAHDIRRRKSDALVLLCGRPH